MQARSQHELTRYMFHYERYNNHDCSLQLAKEQLVEAEKKQEGLSRFKGYPIGELSFLTEGCQTVIECHKLLKWTYVYGYYRTKTLSEIQQELF
mmetsp:Transcript_28241/g.37686  ORF Transcript_28241/g.37686 Transcript_28241/m.37686 type:complete len:94 (-) Transcript_28241:331-612(-)